MWADSKLLNAAGGEEAVDRKADEWENDCIYFMEDWRMDMVEMAG